MLFYNTIRPSALARVHSVQVQMLCPHSHASAFRALRAVPKHDRRVAVRDDRSRDVSVPPRRQAARQR